MAKILHLNDKKQWVPTEKQYYENESELQDMLARDIMVLPLDEIGYDVPFVTIGKEVNLQNGSLDLLAVSTEGHIAVIETKLNKNSEVKRTVVGQILGYAAYLWNQDYESLEGHFRQYLKQRSISFSGQLHEYVREQIGEDAFSESEFKAGIENRLKLGNFSLFIVVDQANQELQDIANYLNERTGQEIDFYVIELELIGDKDERFLVPRLMNPPRKAITAPTAKGDKTEYTTLDEAAFWDSVDHFIAKGDINQFSKERIAELSDLCKYIAEKTSGKIEYLRKKSSTKDIVAILLEDSNNNVSTYIDADFGLGFYMWHKTGPQIDIVQELFNTLIEKKALGRSEKDKLKTQWWLSLKNEKASESEVRQFIDLFKVISTKHLS